MLNNRENADDLYRALDVIKVAKEEKRGLTSEERRKVDFAINKVQRDNEEVRKLATSSYSSLTGDNSQSQSFALEKNETAFSRLNCEPISFGLGDFLRATVLGPRNAAERFALQSGSDSTGGFDVPLPIAATFIDNVRGASAYMTAGANVVVVGDRWKASSITDPVASARAEGASVTVASPFTSNALAPKTISVIAKVSREQLEDSVNIGLELERVLTESVALAADGEIGFGTGGIASTSGILSVTSATNGTAITDYSKLLDAVYSLQSNNTNPNAAIMSPREAKAFAGLKDSTNQPLRRPDNLSQTLLLSSASVPITQTQGTATNASTILVGDFTRLLVGMRAGLRIEVLKEKYADTYEYGFQVSVRMDWLATRPKSFCKVTGLIP